MYQCSKKLFKYKEFSCFDHSDFLTQSMFTFDVYWGSLVILDPDYFPDYLSDSYNYVLTHKNMVELILMSVLKASEAIILTASKIAAIIIFAFEPSSPFEPFTTRIWVTLSN